MPWPKGKKFSDEHRRKMSEAHKGKEQSPETRAAISKANKGDGNGMWNKKGEKSPRWNPDPGYDLKHKRLRDLKPYTGTCERCGKTPPSRVVRLPNLRTRVRRGTEFHNLSLEYRWEDPTDWIEVCKPCHDKLDREQRDASQ
jgi:hypothetical protein